MQEVQPYWDKKKLFTWLFRGCDFFCFVLVLIVVEYVKYKEKIQWIN